ncbi:MAG: T9SS type A sorting domain-containing protein [Edaphocola sp.]
MAKRFIVGQATIPETNRFTGKVLQAHKQVRQATTRIVTDGLADGTYVLIIGWGNGHRTVKLVKQTGANQ